MINISPSITQAKFKTPIAGDTALLTLAQNTYYTLYNISGKGKLKKLSIFNNFYSKQLTVKITIDGVVSSLVGAAQDIVTRGLAASSSSDERSTVGMYILDLTFLNNAKIEVMQSLSASQSISNSALDYVLQ
jgi:hypothetical protein